MLGKLPSKAMEISSSMKLMIPSFNPFKIKSFAARATVKLFKMFTTIDAALGYVVLFIHFEMPLPLHRDLMG